MKGIECWLYSSNKRTTPFAKVMLPAVPKIGDSVSVTTTGTDKITYLVDSFEHVGFDFFYEAKGDVRKPGRVDVYVEA